MKKIILLLTVVLFSCQVIAQILEPAKQVYKSPKLKEAVKAHHVVAILPFNAQITYRKTPKDLDSVAHALEEAELGQQVQFEVYSSLLREFFKYKVRFQNTMETNRLLQQAGMTDNLDAYTKDEIAKALGVDAIIYGDMLRKENTPNVGVVTAAVFGYDKTSEVTLTIKIADGKDGELLWRYSKRMNEMGSVESKDVFERQMEKLTRNLPYTRGVFTVF
jgi:hypothetical protein